jgi:hypothetical protein
MSYEKKTFLLIFFLAIALPSVYGLETNDQWSNWDEQTSITVSIIGDSEINLDSHNRLVRAYVDIVNFDPSDGRYIMRVIQSLTDKIISENEIIIREKSNGEAGSDVAYLIDDDVVQANGTTVLGDYKIEVFSQNGNSIASTTFTLIKPSEYGIKSVANNLESKNSTSESSEELNDIANNESDESYLQTNSELESIPKIPSWVKSIFSLYSDGSITENELLAALEFLIEQGILKINQ